MIYNSFSQDKTEDIAFDIAQNAAPGEVYCLIGRLGAGKTAFARGFARGLGIDDDISSPTFSIINVYHGRLDLFHFDVYRINDVSEMEDTGYEDYFYGRGVALVEWADMVRELWPDDATVVRLEDDVTQGDDFRRIIIERELKT